MGRIEHRTGKLDAWLVRGELLLTGKIARRSGEQQLAAGLELNLVIGIEVDTVDSLQYFAWRH